MTTFLAWWGAIVATLVLLWDVYKWRRSSPRLKVTIDTDGDDPGCHICYHLTNRGDKATTIEAVILVSYFPRIMGLLGFRRCAEAVSRSHRETVKLPVTLQPGEVWSGSSPLSDRMETPNHDYLALIKKGALYYQVRCSHADRPITGKVRLSGPWPRM